MTTAREDETAPGCVSFEATMSLVDGLLAGAEEAAARAHASACGLCGPLVADWVVVADALRTELDDAAERAKPDLARVADAVLARTARESRPQAPNPLAWLLGALRSLEVPVALVAAAGALALVLTPLVNAPAKGPQPVAAVAGDDEPEYAELEEDEDDPLSPGVSVGDLKFEGGSGMLMADGDEMPVIWVNEDDGA